MRPQAIVFGHDFRIFNNAAEFGHNALVHVSLFPKTATHIKVKLCNTKYDLKSGTFSIPDHGVVFVVGIVGISQLSLGSKLELEKFVSELALVAHVVPQIKVAGHLLSLSFKLLSRDPKAANPNTRLKKIVSEQTCKQIKPEKLLFTRFSKAIRNFKDIKRMNNSASLKKHPALPNLNNKTK